MSGRRAAPSGEGAEPEWVVATGNAGKLVEFRAILEDLPVHLVSLAEHPEVVMPGEGDDYTANAIAKARTVARATGRPALADDSGLEVAALDGRPGPHSARYGGPELDDAGRVAKLLGALRDSRVRAARFVCVAALATPDGACETALGICNGEILDAPRGDGGFGYDPVFLPEGQDRAMAELAAETKNRISHRARALRALRPAIDRALGR